MVRLAPRAPVAVGAKRTATLQLLPAGTFAPLQVSLPVVKSPGLAPPRLTLMPLRSADPVLVSVTAWGAPVVPTCWLPNARPAGLRPTAGAGIGVPVPLSATLCGLSAALSTKARLALRAPTAVGAKATSTVQVLPAATVAPLQVSLPVVKSPGLAPVSATLVMARFAASVLVTVTVWAALVVPTSWLPKERPAAEKLAPVPLPVSATLCGLLLALSAKVRLAVRVPAVAGVKATSTLQVPPGATAAAEQLSALLAKSPALAPASVTLVTLSVLLPMLVTATVWVGLATPTYWPPKSTTLNDRLTTEARPAAARATCCMPPSSSSEKVKSAAR